MRYRLALALCLSVIPCRAQESSTPTPTPAPETSTGEVERCVAEHESARMSRLKEQWLEARAAMTRCADERCPLALRSDCSDWLNEIAQMLPTLLVVVERDDDGKQPVRLELDGRVIELPEQLGPIEVLPGRHQLEFRLAGYPPVQREIALAKGEKNRVVRVSFLRPKEPARERPLPAPAAPRLRRASRPVPTSTYLLAGGALAAFAASGSLLASTISSLEAARDRCSPNCRPEERQIIESRLLAADIIAGVGIALGGLAVYTFVRRPVIIEEDYGVASRLQVSPNGARLSIEGRF